MNKLKCNVCGTERGMSTSMLEGISLGFITAQRRGEATSPVMQYPYIAQMWQADYERYSAEHGSWPEGVFKRQMMLLAFGGVIVRECVPEKAELTVEIRRGSVAVRWSQGDDAKMEVTPWGNKHVRIRKMVWGKELPFPCWVERKWTSLDNVLVGATFDLLTDELIITLENLELLRRTVEGVSEA